ncbi:MULTISPECIES: MocR-like pyridoxine biosynthesis transcription factor PdxR [Ureibacillus]|jgi:GntR family transcriptional regulator / MocR family aminotransferase|uniref:GntR family transcriptional regulator/MocR family aminotransferase n=1 Tax=Ureibacillus thermosphaericus TaxID=51173 RepID=A0A840PRN8_URETH|nr:PLP-dependent aminotransferase family protein [Ureibacillus thermosphaericus]MBB5147814.1 GntR family transcriptional regulator/MocR family aminotransferase [Ureibacillus thermosphaericus]NKZ30384.1 PLP-dependent aminotransferase family protein [Ureibacillus thermosphaericus]
MELQFQFPETTPKYIAIYEQLKEKIITKQLRANEKLPSKRKLAEQLNISIQTVQNAYEQLLSEGYIYSVERSGYFISEYNGDWCHIVVKDKPSIELIEENSIYNLKNGQVDAEAFPYKVWQKLYKTQLQKFPAHASPWQGERTLRKNIANYLHIARGIECEPEQIFVFSGTQQQLQALCIFFGNIPVAIEEPGFYRANIIFQQMKYNIEYVRTDHYGATIPTNRVKLYYVTPAHQFPLGAVMPIERKAQLLQWAQATNAYIIEDDYDAEFRYKGLPIPPLANMDQLQRVIYFGTFSKTLLPSIRMSYMVLPISLAVDFQNFYQHQKSTVSRIDQLVVAEFMESGYFVKHIEKMRTLYRKKWKTLIEALQVYLTDEYKIFGDTAGLHIVIQLPPWLSEKRAVQIALEKGIDIDPVSKYYQTTTPQNLVMIGFGAIPLEKIHPVIQTLADGWLQSR